MEFERVLKLRQSVRNYADRMVSKNDLALIIAAAQLSPIAAGDEQTTMITVVTDQGLIEEIRNVCMLKSRTTGKPVDALYGAKTIIFVSATDLSADHIEYCNAGCIIENMLLQTSALGLAGTYIWGCLRKLKASESTLNKLMLPKDYEILSAMVVGYPVESIKERIITKKIRTNIL